MIIVIIHWKIKRGGSYRDDFFRYWKRLEIEDRSEIAGEFLSEPVDESQLTYPCTTLAADDRFDSYFNVGVWSSEDAFRRNVIEPFVGKSPVKKNFEFEYRSRMILSPDWWRVGLSDLPEADHLPPEDS